MIDKKRQKKAQITMFFLIGIFIVSVFVIIFWLNSRMGTAQLEAPSDKIILDLLKTGAIPFYVGQCLEKDSKIGLTYIGQQGGDIYNYQGGSAPDPNKFIPLDYKVSYGISRPYLQNGTTFPEPPGYPGGSGRNKQVPKLNFDGWGRFGEVTLRKLCDVNGANSPFLFGPTITSPICLNNIYTDVLSSQWQLEQYVARLVPNCTNWTAILQETGYNVTPTGDLNVTVRLGLTDMWIDAYIPLKIEVGGVEPVFTVGDFHTRLPVRLKRIVELASLMAMYDSYQLDFNLSKQYTYFSHYDTGMKITVTTPMKAFGFWDDVVSIEDSRSVIDGENFVYRFARENRYPVLDAITNVQDTNYSNFDYVVMENDTIVLDPNEYSGVTDTARMIELGLKRPAIYDPDEDNLTYYYTGWKETCDDSFDFNIGKPVSTCSRLEPTHPSSSFVFPNSIEYLDSSEVHAWTSSEAYLSTGRNATFIPTHEDIGPHNVTIWVCDEAGLCDYQTVRILVLDYPELHLNGTNPFKDIPYDRASVEDYYRFSADGTTAYYTPLLGYSFTDALEPFSIIVQHPLKILDLPRPPPDKARDIAYIHDYVFNRSVLDDCGEIPCQHQVNLSVTSVAVPPYPMNVSVYECLPHRDWKNENASYMWPYNRTNPYAASHLCCSPGSQADHSFNFPSDAPLGSYVVDRVFMDDLEKVVLYNPNNVAVCDSDAQNPLLCAPYILQVGDYSIQVTLGSGALEGNYTIVEEGPADNPEWGNYFGTDKVCHGGTPQVGSRFSFDYEDVDYPTLPPAAIDPILPEWRNDVLAMLYERHCSGVRGNICGGTAVVNFEQLDACTGPDETKGEIESCEGPMKTLLEPVEMKLVDPIVSCSSHTDCAGYSKCVEGKCYTTLSSSPLFDCVAYDGTADNPTSFEKVFNASRISQPGVYGNGTCNPNPSCSDDPTLYKDLNEGPYIIKGATCMRKNDGTGACERALGFEDCSEYNGYSDMSKTTHWCGWQGGTTPFFASSFVCEKGATPADTACSIGSGGVDPDDAEQFCDACTDASGGGKYMTGAWVGAGGDKNCCGDDLGEGGFRYGELNAPGAKRRSGVVGGAGVNGGEICDDYYGNNPADRTTWIDNDCERGANCMDSSCYPNGYKAAREAGEVFWGDYLGPTGGLCCNANFGTGLAGCKEFLDPVGTTAGVDCTGDFVCDCLPVDNYASFITGASSRKVVVDSLPYTVRMCAASQSEFANPDRYTNFTLNGVDPVGRKFSITTTNMVGGNSCQDLVFLQVFADNWIDVSPDIIDSDGFVAVPGTINSFYVSVQSIVPDKDCLVEITIS